MQDFFYNALSTLSPVLALLLLGCVVVIYFLAKEVKSQQAENKTDREKHAKELRELNEYVRTRVLSLKDIITITDSIDDVQKEILNKVENLKDLLNKNG